MIQIKEVVSSQDIKDFVGIQFEIYKNDKMWVPPIIKEERKSYSSETNPALKIFESKFWTAWKNGKCSGRIGAIINKEYNTKINRKMGRFTRMEFIDDKEVSRELFATAENWLRKKGMEYVHGPLGFTNLDHQGLLIEGFNHLPSIASVYHKAYYHEHISDLGYTKENDWVEFRLTLGEAAVKKAIRGAQLIKKRRGFDVLKFEEKSELLEYAPRIFKMLNESFVDLPYVSPINDELIKKYIDEYFEIINPRYVRVILKDGELVAFIITMPSLSKAMQKAKGKLFPLGITHILKALKKPEVIDLLLTGIVPEHHSSGAAVILFAEIQEEMMKQGIDQMETTGIFETNHSVITNWKNYEHIQHKRRRCFVKDL